MSWRIHAVDGYIEEMNNVRDIKGASMRNRTLLCLSVLLLTAADGFAQRQQQRGMPPLQINPEITQRLADALGRDWGEEGTPEWASMASQVLSGQDTMGFGKGWFQPAQTRHNWKWMRAQFDNSPRDGEVTRQELPDSMTDLQFARLDSDRSGTITSRDLLWVNNHMMEGYSPSNHLFQRLDADSNGRLTRLEMKKFFDEQADGFDYITPDDLKVGLSFPPAGATGPRRPQILPIPSRWQLLDLLLSGGLGNLEAGPDLGADAPDFELPILEKDKENNELKLSTDWIRLADSKGKRPVVLIFGSFT
ncbi:MAG: hypothetical protein AB8G99_22360 [Planctomycetaceae bacterium]